LNDPIAISKDIGSALAGQWSLALADAGLVEEDAYLLSLPGRPARDEPKAASYPAGVKLREEADDIIRGPALEEANSSMAIETQRVAIYGAFDEADPVQLAIHGATLRHELRHAEQRLSPAAAELFELDELAGNLLTWKTGGMTGGGLLYNLKPTEIDANDAAALFLRNHHPLQVEAILTGEDGSLARSHTPPAPLEGLVVKTVAFMFLFREIAEDPVRSKALPFEKRLETISVRAAERWRELAWPSS
jgi:hypothetical protein